MHYQFYAKITTFSMKKCLAQLLSKTLVSELLIGNDVKYRCQEVKNDIISGMGLAYTPCLRQKYSERMKVTENLVRCARMLCWFERSLLIGSFNRSSVIACYFRTKVWRKEENSSVTIRKRLVVTVITCEYCFCIIIIIITQLGMV